MKSKYFLVVLFCLFFSILGYSQQTAITQDGKNVLLKGDGTWEYVESKSQKGYKIFEIGTIAKISNLHFCVNSARWNKGDELSLPKSDHIFLIIDCTINNLDDKPIAISSMMMFKLNDKEGYSQDYNLFVDTKGQLDGELSPGQKMRGEIAFEVEKNQTSWEFIFKPDLINLGQIIYSILKEQVK